MDTVGIPRHHSKVSPVKTEKIGPDNVTNSVHVATNGNFYEPNFRLISPRKMENVSRMARRQLTKLREQRLLDKFLIEQNDPPIGNIATAVPTLSELKPEMKQPQNLVLEDAILKEVTKRIKSLIHEMREPNSSEGSETQNRHNYPRKPVSDKHFNKFELGAKKTFDGASNSVVLGRKDAPWDRLAKPKRQESVNVKKSSHLTAAKFKDKATSTDTKRLDAVPDEPKIKLPPYRLRRTTYRRPYRPPRNSSEKPPLITGEKHLRKIPLLTSEKNSPIPQNVEHIIPIRDVEPKAEPMPNAALHQLWQHLLKIELEDERAEYNLRTLHLNRVSIPSSSSSDAGLGNGHFPHGDRKPIILKHSTEDQAVCEKKYNEPTSDRSTMESSPCQHDAKISISHTQDEWTLVNEVSNEVIQHLMDELSNEFQQLPQGILKELFNREFINDQL